MENKFLQDPKQNRILIYVLAGLVLLLIASNVYFVIQKLTPAPAVVVLPDEKIKLKTELDSLEAQIEQVNESKTKMSVEMEAKNDSLKNKIVILRHKLAKGKLTIDELMKANADVNALKTSVNTYAAEIVNLKKKNDSLKTVSDTLSTRLANVNTKASNLEASVKDLGSKVKVASSIKLGNTEINTYRIKNSGKEVDDIRASKVKKIKINFTVASNPIARKGSHDVFAQIIDPAGNLITNAESGTFKADGGDLQFTIQTSIDFKDDGSSYVIAWLNPAAFQTGTYTILFYADGYTMGKTSFTLK